MILSNDISQFLIDGQLNSDESFFYCQTREQSASRYPKWYSRLSSYGISESDASIITAILGELTNNSFDHNLGRWNGPAGCVVKIIKENDQILIFVADRGQGIVSSLSSSAGVGLSGQQVLKKAFEEKISGRSPEKRGNGLKFVMNYIRTLNHALFCFSQNEVYFYGDHFKSLDTAKLPKEFGTLVCICWSIK